MRSRWYIISVYVCRLDVDVYVDGTKKFTKDKLEKFFHTNIV